MPIMICTKCMKAYDSLSEGQTDGSEQLCSHCRSADIRCPECSSTSVHTHIEEDPVLYGTTPNTVAIPCRVPVRKCMACSFEYTDYEAEEIRDKTVQEYLKALQGEKHART